MAEFKYTNEEIEEIIEWFNNRELPQSIQLDDATTIPDTRRTVDSLIVIAKEKKSPIFQPMIEKLFLIRNHILNSEN